MKKIYFIIVGLFLAIGLQAQMEKTIENTAGNLKTLLSPTELSNIANLTITGTIDARDFKILRDEMPVLSEIDISAATILEYYGWEGPNSESYNYLKDEIPWYSFCVSKDAPSGKATLTSVKLPSGITSIGGYAFSKCTGLTTIEIPSLVTYIGIYAFAGSTNLSSIDLPPSITEIGSHAFDYCISLTGVSMPNVTVINDNAFKDCRSLTAITIPPSIISISREAFSGCINLKSITLESVVPYIINISDIFTGVDKTNCILYVPYGTKERYATATEWKTFNTIIEGEQGFLLSSNSLSYEVTGGSDSTINIKANVQWTATSDQTWLSIHPSSGNNSQALIVTALANETAGARTVVITFSAPGFLTQTIQVTQDSPLKTVNITPGGLKTALTDEEKATISNLTITGTMNATDFGTMHYYMPMLTKLDLSAVSIVSYIENSLGCRYDVTYPANTLPGITPYCPNYKLEHLSSLILPNSLTAIGWYALGNSNFTSIVIPPSVTTIEDAAFKDSKELISITIPPSVSTLGMEVFSGCSSLTTVELPPSIISISDNTFFECIALNSIDIPSSVTSIGGDAFYGCSSLSEISLPPSLISIGYDAFYACTALTSVVIPASVTSIGGFAFTNCTNLRTISIPPLVKDLVPTIFNNCTSLSAIYLYSPIPPRIGIDNPWEGVDRSTCILYVPNGTAGLYAAAQGWKEFIHIVEMIEFRISLSAITLESGEGTVTAEVTADVEWTAYSDQPWLTISPAAGNFTQTVTFTAQENTAPDERTATITFTALNGFSQTVIIIQNAKVNSIPLANAGTDQSVEEGETVQLDGSASDDADNDPLIYEWRAPEGITLSSTSDAQPTFTAPRVERDTAYTFKLVVKDGKETSVSDRVIITVTNMKIELRLSDNTIVFESKESTAEILITGNAEWMIISDQSWLTVSPDEGTGEKEFAVTANANRESTARTAIVTVSATEVEDQTIVVTQKGMVTDVAEMNQNRPIITYYPNPFKVKMTIDISNPKKEKITVDIYNITGQRVKNLTIGNKAEKITLSWDGSNDQGQKVPEGMYLLKMNEMVKLIVKRE